MFRTSLKYSDAGSSQLLTVSSEAIVAWNRPWMWRLAVYWFSQSRKLNVSVGSSQFSASLSASLTRRASSSESASRSAWWIDGKFLADRRAQAATSRGDLMELPVDPPCRAACRAHARGD